MPGVEKRVARDGRTYYRARYLRPDGKKGSVLGTDGKAIKYPTKNTALKAARDAEAEADAAVGRGRWVAPEAGRLTLREYVLGPDDDPETEGWLAAQDLAASSEQSYAHYLKHIMAAFGDQALADIGSRAIEAWEKQMRAVGAASSAATYRRVLHLILEDAVDDGRLAVNPAKRRRNRGKRAGRSSTRGPEKKITNSLGILLLAERASLLTGRDDEFVATVLTGYTGMRWGEIVGLQAGFVRDQLVRVEQQLWEPDSGDLVLCPPKDDSYRGIDAPRWLTGLVRAHIARSGLKTCSCHEKVFAFRGGGLGRRGSRTGPSLKEVAQAAGVSTGTVSNVLNRPDLVRGETRGRVEAAIEKLEYVRGGHVSKQAAHWRRSGYATWVFTPAATGWYPPKAPQPKHLVPIIAEPWPGVPARGRGAPARATACWLPIQDGLTRHGLRHTHRTVMEELGTPKVLMDERMGHIDTSVSANYAHVTDGMRAALVQALTELWEASLAERAAMSPSSLVPVLDGLLAAHR